MPLHDRVPLPDGEVGQTIPDLPRFLSPGRAIDLPLEAIYSETVADLPASDRRRLESA